MVGVLLSGLCLTAPVRAQSVAVGQATMIVRSVQGLVDTARRPLAVDDPVFWQELIETGAESASKLVFLDATTLSTGPDSRVRIDEFVYAGSGESRRIVVSIGRGVLRFVTGRSPSSAYSIRTPNAMIGVRGTDFTVSVDDGGATRVLVRNGEVGVTPGSGAPILVPAGLALTVLADGMPETPEPGPADGELQAAAAEVTALLAIAGEGDTAGAFEDEDVTAVGGLRGQAASVRAGTAASQVGAGCGGC